MFFFRDVRIVTGYPFNFLPNISSGLTSGQIQIFRFDEKLSTKIANLMNYIRSFFFLI